MYLVLRASYEGVSFATIDTDGAVVAHHEWANREWDSLSVRKLKDTLQHELKSHGRVFHGIGYVLPFGDGVDESPRLAQTALLKSLVSSPLHDAILKPSRLVFEAGQQLWPHLPHIFCFDTCLSTDLPKQLILPGMSYDITQAWHLSPKLVHSYGHKANSAMVRAGQKFISLYCDQSVSIALFDGTAVKDACVSYSPLSPLPSFSHGGTIDLGTAALLADRVPVRDRTTFVLKQTGLETQLDHDFDFEESLQIAGLVPRKDLGFMDRIEIERIEWTELTMKSFVRSLRQALAGMLATDNSVKTMVVNTATIPQKSGFWPLLTEGILSQLMLVFSDRLDLQAAGEDIIAFHSE